ncbi:unnamed protein product [Macrosiphum euphorbiae]|uniref:Uncharacterized protein n=1 Tax=Macrosiphum euphorbiae TaxID=13131 RepID=A0AAV0VZI4_9HEMI|nr:unnamed protein product [Macrosiphum euphorbiae]
MRLKRNVFQSASGSMPVGRSYGSTATVSAVVIAAMVVAATTVVVVVVVRECGVRLVNPMADWTHAAVACNITKPSQNTFTGNVIAFPPIREPPELIMILQSAAGVAVRRNVL